MEEAVTSRGSGWRRSIRSSSHGRFGGTVDLTPAPLLAEKREEALAEAIEAAVNLARQRADAKRVDQAILARAFRGEL